MSLVTIRGGFPRVFKDTVTHTAGRAHLLPGRINYLQVRATTNSCKVYFTEADFDNDENFVLVIPAAAEQPHGWEGPADIKQVWLRGVTGSSEVEMVGYERIG